MTRIRLSTDFWANVFYNIIDQAEEFIKERFIPNEDLYKDCSWLDLGKFEEISNMKSILEFPASTFVKISELKGWSRISLLDELEQFAGQYDNLTQNWRKLHAATAAEGHLDRGHAEDALKSSDSEGEFDPDRPVAQAHHMMKIGTVLHVRDACFQFYMN